MEQDAETLKMLEIVDSLKGTLMGEILDAMLAEKSGVNTESVAPGDKVAREMNAYEKALDFLSHKYCLEGDEIGRLINKAQVDEAEKGELIKRFQDRKNKMDACRGLLKTSLFSCIAEYAPSEFFGVGVREGNQIVLIRPQTKRASFPPDSAMSILIIVGE